jgi:hypothetical protein
MRLANAEHQSQPWRIRDVAPDFTVEDVWALPAVGGAGDFQALIEVMASLDPATGDSRASRALFGVRRRLGRWLGWDDAGVLPVPGDSATSLAGRLPADLRGTAADPGLRSGRFAPLYRTDAEWAGELSNRTVHAVMHLAWADQGDGRYRGQLAVYVKPRGRLGKYYMTLIAPFRRLVVYPAAIRQIGQAWNARVRH